MKDDSVSLREHFERLLAERDARYMQMFKSAEEAVTKAETALKEYKIQANEFRGTLTDQAKTFMPRDEAENRFNQQAERVRNLELAERSDEGGRSASASSKSNFQSNVGLIIGVFGLIIAALAMFLRRT